ncbi:MAG: Uma2 family endonuclease [Pseudonocardiales bacterium]|nr:Uma2 family endonuclease [Pseudonocardiales bacterium]
MTEANVMAPPPDGWTVDDLDAMPVSNHRYELTDGALTVSPSPSSLHQVFAAHLFTALEARAPEPFVVTQAVEIRFARQLTRIPDLLVIRSDQPGRHWFAPSEVLVAIEIESPGSHIEDRATKPALYARYGIPHYWRFELDAVKVSVYGIGNGDRYQLSAEGSRLTVGEPFTVDLELRDLLPRWARD